MNPLKVFKPGAIVLHVTDTVIHVWYNDTHSVDVVNVATGNSIDCYNWIDKPVSIKQAIDWCEKRIMTHTKPIPKNVF